MLTKLLNFIKGNQKEIILFLGMFLASIFSFMAGYVIAKNELKEPIKIIDCQNWPAEQ